MPTQGKSYTFIFALIVCVVCSFTLSLVSEGLRPQKELNVKLDIKKNILKAVKLKEPVDPKAPSDQIIEVYESKIKEVVVDVNGEIVSGKTPADIQEGEELYPLYIYQEGQRKVAYAFPIVGKGLWSTLYGYFSLEPDAMTVRGITFYKHGETPGLGAEIEKDWFQENFEGKSIYDVDADQLKPVEVVKGAATEDRFGDQVDYYVDGISGATVTANGVTEMIDREVKKYEPFLKSIRTL